MSDQDLEIAQAVAATRRAKRPGEDEPGPEVAPAKPEIEYESVKIDLPPHAPDVRIDGRVFQHGLTYKVTAVQAASMREIMFRAWSHEEEVRGQRTGFAPKSRNQAISGRPYR